MNKNIILKIDYVKFFDNINNYTSFERKRILSDLTNGFDLNLLTEFSNSFVQYCFLKFNEVNKSLPYIEPIETEAGAIRLNEIHFPFYEFIKNEIYKEVSIEVFNNLSFEQCIQFNKNLDFLDEIETIIENQNIKIIGTTPEAVKPDEIYKTQILFKVGLLFATGKMNKYFTINSKNNEIVSNGLSPLKIANELENPSFEKYILASKNNYKTGENKNKNIFNNFDMMTKIIDHCIAEKLEIDPYFESRLPIA